LEGSVTMSVTSAILGSAAHGAPGVSIAQYAEASGRAGWNGGVIAIDAPKGSVSMQGAIHGICGGDGGEATAGQPAIVGVPHKQRGGSAAGGCGGQGGDVIICALEEITIGGPVIGA